MNLVQTDQAVPRLLRPPRPAATRGVLDDLDAQLQGLLDAESAPPHRHHERGCSHQLQPRRFGPASNVNDRVDESEPVRLGEGRCFAVRPPTCDSVAQGATLKSLHPGNPLLWIRALELQVVADLWMRKDEETLIDDRLIDDVGYVGRFEHLAD